MLPLKIMDWQTLTLVVSDGAERLLLGWRHRLVWWRHRWIRIVEAIPGLLVPRWSQRHVVLENKNNFMSIKQSFLNVDQSGLILSIFVCFTSQCKDKLKKLEDIVVFEPKVLPSPWTTLLPLNASLLLGAYIDIMIMSRVTRFGKSLQVFGSFLRFISYLAKCWTYLGKFMTSFG